MLNFRACLEKQRHPAFVFPDKYFKCFHILPFDCNLGNAHLNLRNTLRNIKLVKSR